MDRKEKAKEIYDRYYGGRERPPDAAIAEYERVKRHLAAECKNSSEYERRIKEICYSLGI